MMVHSSNQRTRVVALFFMTLNNSTHTMREKIATTNGVSICTESFGKKEHPAVLLLAGATVSMLYWDEEFCQQLADKGLYVIRYDNRDVGKSTHYTPGTTPYDIVDLTDDAFAILDAYNLDTAHFVGMSLGGMIAQIAALKHPHRVQSLTLMSTGPWGDPDPTVPDMDQRIIDFHALATSVNWDNEEEVVRYMLKGAALISGKKPSDAARGEKLIREEYKRAHNYRSMFNHAALQGGEEWYNKIRDITQPTLIIHGTEDLICHFDNTNTMVENIRNATRVVLEGTGHELHRDDWDAIINSIANHITSV